MSKITGIKLRHYCEACGFNDLKSKLNGYMCCWFMGELEHNTSEVVA